MGLFKKDKWNDALVYVSFAYQQLEKLEESRFIIDKLKHHMKNENVKGFRIKPNNWYIQSLIDIVEGNKELAIASLQRAVDQGWAQSWCIQSEPILRSVAKNPSYKEVLQSFQTRINIMREQLEFEQKFTSVW